MVNLRKSGVDLFKYKAVNKAVISFTYTLKAGKLASVQSV